MLDSTKPRPFDLSKPEEMDRLLHEVAGYLHTCRREHHGTDFTGRQFAIEGIQALQKKTALLRRLRASNRRILREQDVNIHKRSSE